MVRGKGDWAMKREAYETLDEMRLPNGLYVASLSRDYRHIWIRDTCYTVFPYVHQDDGKYEQTYWSMLDIFKRYEWKIDIHRKQRPIEVYEYIHPRYSAETCEELPSPWGNAQNDAIGLFLYGLGYGYKSGKRVLRDDRDKAIVRKICEYLYTLEYWNDEDNGMWEENREWHASSVGACIAGLRAVQDLAAVPDAWITKGLRALYQRLPNESDSKEVDLALLSLIYPYQLLPRELTNEIVTMVEQRLLRDRGVIRYIGDLYYNFHGKEAEWCFGIPWLGLCHLELGNLEKAKMYKDWTESLMIRPGILPELYYGGTDTPNPNTPLAWGVSMYIQLTERLESSAMTAKKSAI
jgi:hypothetical protein